MRRLLIAGVVGMMVISLAACEGSNSNAEAEQKLQQEADFWEIDQIETIASGRGVRTRTLLNKIHGRGRWRSCRPGSWCQRRT